jgi:hypothetical protein
MLVNEEGRAFFMRKSGSVNGSFASSTSDFIGPVDQPRVAWPLGGGREAISRRRDAMVLGGIVVLGLLAGALPLDPWERVVLSTIALGAAFRFVTVLRARRLLAPRGSVTADVDGLVRQDPNGTLTLASWGGSFGLTILSNHVRERALLAFTTPEQTRYVTVRFSSPEDDALAKQLLARAATVPESDALVSYGDEASLRPEHALELLAVIAKHSPSAVERLYLSGSRGEPLVLEGAELRVGPRIFDLESALEWRGFMFHESVGPIATIYQATWIRQGTSELVLVAPMPPEISSFLGADAGETIALVRDLKLMQSLPDSPPPRELRVGIDRLFMLPLRQALDKAPRASRAGITQSDQLAPKPL